MDIPFSALDQQHVALSSDILAAIEAVLQTAHFTLGAPVVEFEERFAQYHQLPFAIGVNSGSDALVLSLRALGIGEGDEVITTANTFITTVSSIALVGAKPVMVDIAEDDNIDVDQIEQHITERTKAILPVHWTGRPCNMARISKIAERHRLAIIEDCAQAVSAKYDGQLVGTFGDLGCFSLHPYKTLNACGDAGVIITKDSALADKIRALRQNGLSPNGVCHHWSNNSRLDTMQAAILNIKLKHFEAWTKRRIAIAAYYSEHLKAVQQIVTPALPNGLYDAVFHTYIIKAQRRDELQRYLKSHGIETRIHYQTPIYKQPIAVETLSCSPKDFPAMEYVASHALSLPLYPELTLDQQRFIIETIKAFYAVSQPKKQNNAGTTIHLKRKIPCMYLTHI